MTQEIAIPFRLDAAGGIAVETQLDRQVAQHVRALVATQPGERVMMRGYGVDTLSMLFEPDDEVSLAELSGEINRALATWEPSARSAVITPVPNDAMDGLAEVRVEFARSDTASPVAPDRLVNTATIRPGGQVKVVVGG